MLRCQGSWLGASWGDGGCAGSLSVGVGGVILRSVLVCRRSALAKRACQRRAEFLHCKTGHNALQYCPVGVYGWAQLRQFLTGNWFPSARTVEQRRDAV